MMYLPISSIRVDGGTQPRATINLQTVSDYMNDMAGGAEFPPVDVFYDGSNYWLADGFHRIKAAEKSGRDEIACEVLQGTQQDAQWYSFGANKGNGLRRTNQDKQRAVKAALQHPGGASLSDVQIAAHVVVGTSGLTEADFAEIDAVARERRRGVLACGNFALTVVLLQKFAEAAARLIPHWEIIDYAHDDKADAPSGTARELAYRLGQVRSPRATVALADTVGPVEARGASVNGTQVHSIRLPGYVIGAEVVFGLPEQRLTIRHDAGSGARPYADGALLAIRKVATLVGVHRGLDRVLEL